MLCMKSQNVVANKLPFEEKKAFLPPFDMGRSRDEPPEDLPHVHYGHITGSLPEPKEVFQVDHRLSQTFET